MKNKKTDIPQPKIQLPACNNQKTINPQMTEQSQKTEQSSFTLQSQQRSQSLHSEQFDHGIFQSFANLYTQLMGEEKAKLNLPKCKNNKDGGKAMDSMTTDMIEEIVRLQKLAEEYLKIRQLLDKNTGSQSQDIWKAIIISYKQKTNKLEQTIISERKEKTILQEQLRLKEEQTAHLEHLNTLKINRISTLVQEVDQRDSQMDHLNQTITQLQLDVSQINQSLGQLRQKITQTQKERLELTAFMDSERERASEVQAEQSYTINVLSQSEYQIHREIADLKQKYQSQIVKLQASLGHLSMQKQELLLQLLTSKSQLHHQSCQTEEVTDGNSCFNSLADQLTDHDAFRQESRQLNDPREKETTDEEQFQLQLSGHHLPNEQNLSQPFLLQDHLHCQKHNKIEQSFDQDSYSISNSPSRYVETVEQLSNELTNAYEKNNALTRQIEELQTTIEAQSRKIETLTKKPERKIEERLERKNERIDYMGGYIKSFFKK